MRGKFGAIYRMLIVEVRGSLERGLRRHRRVEGIKADWGIEGREAELGGSIEVYKCLRQGVRSLGPTCRSWSVLLHPPMLMDSKV